MIRLPALGESGLDAYWRQQDSNEGKDQPSMACEHGAPTARLATLIKVPVQAEERKSEQGQNRLLVNLEVDHTIAAPTRTVGCKRQKIEQQILRRPEYGHNGR